MKKLLAIAIAALLSFPAVAATYDTELQKLYVAYFGRPADPVGLTYWNNVVSNAVAGGQDPKAILDAVRDSFGASHEYLANFNNLTSVQKIAKIYKNLFSHDPDPTGLVYWATRLESGELNIGQISKIIVDVALEDPTNADGIAFNSKVTAAGLFTNALDSTDEIIGYSGLAAGNLAKAFIARINSAETLSNETSADALSATVTTVTNAGNGISSSVTINSDNAGANGKTISSNDNTTTAGTSTVISTFGTMSTPLAGAIAFGDGGFPTYSDTLTSHTFGAQGALVAYNIIGGMDSGSNAQASVCSVSSCNEPNTIRWGTWASGSAEVSSQNVSPSNGNLLHYIVGSATPISEFTGLTGASYAMVGQTTPTGTDGNAYTASIGPISVNFTNSTATLTSYALSGNNLNTAAYSFNNVGLTLSNSPNNTTKVISGFQTNAANNTLTLNGFFAGANARYIGAAIKTTDNSGMFGVNQAAAFKR